MATLHVITGFLGSGKTTLLRHLMQQADSNTAVIVNEFASYGIDGKLLQDSGTEVAELTNGCVCCTRSDDLEAQILALKGKQVLVETTGVAEPDPLLKVLQRTGATLRNFITVVDAKQFARAGGLGRITERQIALSNLVIINKIDTIDKQTIKKLKSVIKSLGSAKILAVEYGRAPIKELQRTVVPHITPAKTKPSHQSSSMVLHGNGEVDSTEVIELFNSTNVDRAKGYALTEKGWLLFQKATGLLSVEPIAQQKGNTFVFIGELGLLEKLRLLRRVEAIATKSCMGKNVVQLLRSFR